MIEQILLFIADALIVVAIQNAEQWAKAAWRRRKPKRKTPSG